MSVSAIATRTGLSEPTLRKYYLRELDHGAQALRAAIVAAVFDKAREGNVPAAKLALQILEKGEAAVPVARHAAKADKPLGKKEAADAAAKTAHEGTEWGKLLRH
jgi:predicted transcriptional regulator